MKSINSSVKPARKRSAALEPTPEPKPEPTPALTPAPTPTTTRERVLHAAVQLLNEDGFAALTQQHVCERAGIRQSHLTYYFPTRNDLLRETAAYGCEMMLAAMSAVTQARQLTIKEIRAQLFSVDESDRRMSRLMIALVAASDEDPRIKPWFGAFENENRAKLSAVLRNAGLVLADADIELLHAAYVGAVVLDLGESSAESLERARNVVHHAFDVVTRGIASPVVARKQPKKASTPRTKSAKS